MTFAVFFATVFRNRHVESLVPEHAELALWLSWFLPLGRLQRNPTLKAEIEALDRRSPPVAFFTYPAMQAADILLHRAHPVPVGEDQLPHVEMAREAARRFNRRFGRLFPEPESLVGRVPRLVGLDGRAKMSKSLDNAIYIKDPAGVVEEKVRPPRRKTVLPTRWAVRWTPRWPGSPGRSCSKMQTDSSPARIGPRPMPCGCWQNRFCQIRPWFPANPAP